MNAAYREFLDELLTHVAATASLKYAATPRQLWHSTVNETPSPAQPAPAADPYTVMRIYGGGLELVPAHRCQVQVKTTGKVASQAWAQCQAVFDSLLDSGGQPLRMKDLTHYRLNAVELAAIQEIGQDERGRTLVVFNLDARFVRLS